MKNSTFKHFKGLALAAFIAAGMATTGTSQTWESIDTPVETNLILFDISFPGDQNEIGFTAGSNVTYNGKGTYLKTIDGGETWSIIYESTVNGTGSESLYFISTTKGFIGTMGGDLMVTEDGGDTFEALDIDPLSDQGSILAIDFIDDMNGVLSSQWNGIYRTVDGGTTWTAATTGTGSMNDLHFVTEDLVFGCRGDQKIFKSEDAGDTWSNVYSGYIQIENIGIQFYDENYGLCTSEEGVYFKTVDGGETWTEIINANYPPLTRGIWPVDSATWYVCSTPGDIYITEDGGTSWTSDGGVNFDPSYYKILFTPDGTGFVCGSGSTGGTILKKEPTGGVNVDDMVNPALTVFPVPSKDVINVQFNEATKAAQWINIYDVYGKKVSSVMINGKLFGEIEQIDIRSLANGSYILTIENENGVISKEKIQVLK